MGKQLWVVAVYRFYRGGSKHVDAFKVKDFNDLKRSGKIKVEAVLRKYYS